MRKSIKYKLFIGINALVVIFVLLFWLLNTEFLEKYYIYEKKKSLIESTDKINEIYKGEPTSIALELEKLENSSGANILILGSDGKPKYSTFARNINEKRFEKRIPLDPKGRGVINSNEGTDSYNLVEMPYGEKMIFGIQNDLKSNMDFLTIIRILDTRESIIIRTPLPAITENASIANSFIIFIGFIALILGSIVAYFFSNKFTKPILELNKITESMAKLDFTQISNIKSEDEIGELSKNINFLSNKLDNTIYELNEKNQKLVEDIERERKIDEMRKEFVSNVSHELKTPIALIQGYAEGLRSNVIEDDESKNFYCNVIVNESTRMNQLVKDLLNLSQIESGYYQLDKEVFNVSSMIESVINKYRAIFEEKDIQLRLIKGEEAIGYGDMVRIEQIVINYINNALNHVDNEKIINVTVQQNKEKIRVYVFNSGKSIPEDALDKIWISFYKVDKSRTRSYGGSGLGLSIVKGIQELHGNEYGVENLSDGVSFWFDVDRAVDKDN